MCCRTGGWQDAVQASGHHVQPVALARLPRRTAHAGRQLHPAEVALLMSQIWLRKERLHYDAIMTDVGNSSSNMLLVTMCCDLSPLHSTVLHALDMLLTTRVLKPYTTAKLERLPWCLCLPEVLCT
jgi:hypothetical protein